MTDLEKLEALYNVLVSCDLYHDEFEAIEMANIIKAFERAGIPVVDKAKKTTALERIKKLENVLEECIAYMDPREKMSPDIERTVDKAKGVLEKARS